MHSLFLVIDIALNFYSAAVVCSVILSWLVAFDVLNLRNRLVYALYDGLNRFVSPALQQIRRYLPAMGGLDLSPFVLILAIVFVRNLIREYGFL